MNQTLRILLPITVISSLTFVMQCANPVDEPPLRWESKAELPISNKNFYLKTEFDNMFDFDSMAFIDKNPALSDSGDTMIFSIHRFNADTFETNEDSLKDKRYVAYLGPIKISSVPILQSSGPIAAAAGSFSFPLPVTLDSIYNVAFDSTSNKLPVVITNSSQATLSNVIIDAGTLGSDTINSISAGNSDTAWLPVNGKQANHTITITLSGTKNAGAGTVGISIDVNGLRASSIKANDHLLQFSKEIINKYDITDTVDLDYVDIADGFFNYSIANHSGIPLSVQGDHQHLWTTSYCIQTFKTRAEDLTSISAIDSSNHYSGKLTGRVSTGGISTRTEILVDPMTEQELTDKNISSNRIFTEWDTTLQKSVTVVKYIVKTATPKGDTLAVSSSDSIVFIMKSTSFKFKEFVGTVMEEYFRVGDTQKIFIDAPWPQASQDSLRGKFILKNVSGDVSVSPNMPDSAYIDTMNIQFVAFSPESLSIQDSTHATFTNLRKDSTFQRSIDLTAITNLFPDSIYVTANVRIPVGTRMKVCNDLFAGDPDFQKYIGRMKIGLKTNYFLNSDLDWEIVDTVRMDLGSGDFKVPQELRYVKKLENRNATFRLKIKNQSNLNMFLYSLLAPQTHMDSLDSIDGNELTYLIDHPDSAKALGFITFIDGLFIPLRDSTSIDTIRWDDDALKAIVSSDSCSWRWQLRFLPKSRDALKDVDYLQINSAFRVEGINNMDSLIIWE